MNWPAALTSLGLHAALLLVLLLESPEVVPPKPGAPATGVQIIVEPPSILSGGRGHGLACGGRRYNGMGFAVSGLTGEVDQVGWNTPAARAGIRTGDVLVAPALHPNTYPTQTVVVVTLRRAGHEVQIPVTVESICQE